MTRWFPLLPHAISWNDRGPRDLVQLQECRIGEKRRSRQKEKTEIYEAGTKLKEQRQQ